MYVRPIVWKMLAWLWLSAVTYALVIPGNNLPKSNLFDLPFFDKIVHVLLFAVLAVLALKAYTNNTKGLALKIFIGIVLYGTAMEFVQKHLVPFRSFDVVDILADTLGALLGWVMFSFPANKSST